MVDSPVVARIWDYGWLSRDELQLPPAPSAPSLIASYVASPHFGTSFLPSDKDESSIHGPFMRSRISSDDFVLFEEAALQPYLDQLFLSPEWNKPATPDQCSAVSAALRAAFEGSAICYRLFFDETSSSLHHEWGFVFTVFRELLFLQPESGHVTRFVIGYD
jgi:hypothetical protein